MSDPNKMNDQAANAAKLEELAINTIRIVGAEAVDKANSGHPGIVLGAAPMAYAIWANHMRFDPKDLAWDNRDRFVLSAGHGSMLVYMLMHLFTEEVTIEDVKEFRQWGGRTAGHPEYHLIPGIICCRNIGIHHQRPKTKYTKRETDYQEHKERYFK